MRYRRAVNQSEGEIRWSHRMKTTILITMAGSLLRSVGSTACAFGRAPGDEKALYVTTDGGFLIPHENGIQDAKLVRMEVGGRGLFEPADGLFWEAVRREDPELYRSIKPWSKLFEPDPLRALLLECGVSDPEVVAEPGWHPLRTPEDWWTIILGSGYRSTVDALSPPNREQVRTASIDGVRRADIRQIRTDVVNARAGRLA